MIVIALVVGMLLQLHIRSAVLGFWTRPYAFQKFLSEVRSTNTLSPHQFWEFRERFSPGKFTFDADVKHWETQLIQQLPSNGMPLHTFTSSHMVSKDFVVQKNPQIGQTEQARNFLGTQLSLPMSENILYASETDLVFWSENGKRILFFYRPIEELYQVDGLFDFTPAERTLLEDTFWVNITEIQ